MSTTPTPLALQPTGEKPSLKAPVILFVLLLLAINVSVTWLRSRADKASPIFHKTAGGWQRLPSPLGRPERLRVSSGGTVWLVTWGHTALSRWDGSRWHYYKATDFGTKTSYSDGSFALDGEEVWAPSTEGILHWDGQRWHADQSVKTSREASIVAGAGQVWLIDDVEKIHHFEKGRWSTQKLVLPGVNTEKADDGGTPELARTSDGSVWLVWGRVWRLDGAQWAEVLADGKPMDGVNLIGAAGDRLWLEESLGLRAVSRIDAQSKVYSETQTGIGENALVTDVASDGKLTWFATSAGVTEFDGAQWRTLQRPGQEQGIHAIAAAPDGSLWTIGSTRGGLFQGVPYMSVVLLAVPLCMIGTVIWFFQRLRRRQLYDHQRVTQAVQHATGEIPAELEIGANQLGKSGLSWFITIFGSAIGFFIIRMIWPTAPYWTAPVLVIAIHLAIGFQQSLVKRKLQASDPIGPGAPSQYDWGKTLKSVAGAMFFVLIFAANRFPALSFLRGYTFWVGLAIVMAYKTFGVHLMNQATRRGDYDKALNIVRWFHFYNPSGSEAMRMSGHILLMAGRYRQAEDALRRSFTSSHAAQTYGMALEYLGDALMEQGRYDEATRSFEAALHTFTWLRRPYRGISEMSLRRGNDAQQSLAYVEKIVDFAGLSKIQRQNNGKPQDDYWALKAWALASSGRSSEVASAIEEALKATDPKCLPDLATTHYRAGMAAKTMGNMTIANGHFRKAVEFDPRGRRGILANAALNETSAWGKSRTLEAKPESTPEGTFAR